MNMADLDAQEPLSNTSDCSFVILGHGSIPVDDTLDHLKESLKADSLADSKSTLSNSKYTNCSDSDKSQSGWCINGNSSCEEDTQKKLDEIIKENSQLKETLVQNNLAIKSQLDTFFMWQQEVLKTHEIHKQKFLETKDLILKLRAENINLKKQMEESVGRVSNTKEKEVFVQVDKKAEELDELKTKMIEIEKICKDLTGKNENLVKENEKLREELKAENREISNLNRSLQRFEKEVESLKQSSEGSKKNSLESSSLFRSVLNSEPETQICNLLKQLEEEKGKVAKLSEELKQAKSSNEEVKKSTAEELNECIDKINDVNASLERQNQTFNSLHSWVALAEENLKEGKVGEGVDSNLVGEINKLKNELNQKGAFLEKQEHLQELRRQFNKLLLDYQNLQQQLQTIQNNVPVQDYVAEISSLSDELQTKEVKLLSKEKECEKLRGIIQNLQADSEEAAVLRIQVEVYRADFDEEQKQRKQLFAEKEDLLGKVEFLESRIVELENEKESPGKKEQIVCPICVISFSDSETYDNHREECCNIDYAF